MMERIYLDNACTSYPKPPSVITDYMTQYGTNINRSSYSPAYALESIVLETRQSLARLFDFDNVKNVIFTANITTSLNMVLKGLLKKGDHVLVSSMVSHSTGFLAQKRENFFWKQQKPCSSHQHVP